jgi:hypothetical protein
LSGSKASSRLYTGIMASDLPSNLRIIPARERVCEVGAMSSY